jgi:ankyrin repeat protein
MVLEFEGDITKRSNLLQFVICHCDEASATYYTSMFLAQGANVCSLDPTLSTPLHLAIAKNYTAIVRMLLERGADVNANDMMQRSCLDMAVGPW